MGCSPSVIIDEVKTQARNKAGIEQFSLTRDDLPQVIAGVKSSTKTEAQKKTLKSLTWFCENDEGAAEQVVKQAGVDNLIAWTASKDAVVQNSAYGCLQALCALGGAGPKALTTEDFMNLMTTQSRHKNINVVRNVVTTLAALAACKDSRVFMGDSGMTALSVGFIKSKDAGVKRIGCKFMANLVDEAKNAQKVVEADLDIVLKTLFELQQLDDTETEKWALVSMARLCVVEEFAEKVVATNKLPKIMKFAQDNIATRKTAASLALANLADHKDLRIKLVKNRVFQLFVDMGKVSSQRPDMQEFQRIAALGIRNLAASFQLREVAAKVGVLEIVTKMLNSPSNEVKRYAAKAVAELTLHEENGRKLCLGGAMRPLLEMCRSGDGYCEHEATKAIVNLSINPENQRQMMAEGGQQVLNYLKNSKNPDVVKAAQGLTKRILNVKLKTAAKFAGRVAVQKQQELAEEEERARVQSKRTGGNPGLPPLRRG